MSVRATKLFKGDKLVIAIEGTDTVITCYCDGEHEPARFTIESDMPDAQERCCQSPEGWVYAEILQEDSDESR